MTPYLINDPRTPKKNIAKPAQHRTLKNSKEHKGMQRNNSKKQHWNNRKNRKGCFIGKSDFSIQIAQPNGSSMRVLGLEAWRLDWHPFDSFTSWMLHMLIISLLVFLHIWIYKILRHSPWNMFLKKDVWSGDKVHFTIYLKRTLPAGVFLP